MKWNMRRARELEALRAMLYELSGLDRGSSFIGKTQRCIETARRLMNGNSRTMRVAFIDFLWQQCIDERGAVKAEKAK